MAVAVEVSDRYPEPMGPHVVRSETRRITVLSKVDYLRQIEMQKDRLLSRVQTVYRQQRTAHEAIGTLDPASQGYAQACQLEAIRQEMVRDQLKDVASSLQLLLDDLEANGVSDVAEGAALEAVRVALIAIAENQLADAARILRQQSGMARDGEASGSEKASDAVNAAARDLGALVMLRGIDSAQEVYARELRMLARIQSVLRWQAITRDRPEMMQKIAQRQSEMAVWTENSFPTAGRNAISTKASGNAPFDPGVKKLQNVRTVQRMIEVHSLIGKGDVNNATNVWNGSDVVGCRVQCAFEWRLFDITGSQRTDPCTRRGAASYRQRVQRNECRGIQVAAISEHPDSTGVAQAVDYDPVAVSPPVSCWSAG